ncbi:hypothetical protein DTL42_07605 [Bremerella cremea]|uniref:Lipoprotein n=1 Tax=Bremerella cremea TaxID=1031537 RepID=A0A368KUV7_9BACT|nr:hypothetical protein [Bremerella cremea]RCS52694.1 hypothetical protein DTL42_07605 [Bremerella cremea]
MTKYYAWPAIIIGALLLSGCLDFGPNISTTKPTAEHVKYCRSEMYLNPQIIIEPQGFKLLSGIDRYVEFKFVAHTNDVSKLFLSPPVDALLMQPNYVFNGGSDEVWWDPPSSGLIGANYNLPNVRFMKAAYVDNGDGTLTVYIIWHET